MTKFTGPYLIAAYNGRGNYTIKYIESNKILGNYNQQNFKKFIESEQESTDTAEEEITVIPESDIDEEDEQEITCIPETDMSDDSVLPSAQPNQCKSVNISEGNSSGILPPLSDDDQPMTSTPVL